MLAGNDLRPAVDSDGFAKMAGGLQLSAEIAAPGLPDWHGPKLGERGHDMGRLQYNRSFDS
jgi:hypothetical protein